MANVMKKVYRIADVADAMGCTRTTIANMIKRGDIPAPMRLGKSRPFWPAFEIEAALKRTAPTDQPKQAA